MLMAFIGNACWLFAPSQRRSEGCGPHRAAFARGGKRAKIVLKIHVKIQTVISYVFACK